MTNNELLQIKIILNQPIDNKTHFPTRFFLYLRKWEVLLLK